LKKSLLKIILLLYFYKTSSLKLSYNFKNFGFNKNDKVVKETKAAIKRLEQAIEQITIVQE
jgi:hypothetical protein